MIPRSKKHSEIPGDTTREMTARAKDSSGREWSAGTVFAPLCGGCDNSHGQPRRYIEVSIRMERVTFYE